MKLYHKLLAGVAGLVLALGLILVPALNHKALADWNNQCDNWQMDVDRYMTEIIWLEINGFDTTLEYEQSWASLNLTMSIMTDIGCYGYQ